MRRLVLFIIAATVAFAQAPADTLITKLAERDTPQKRFLRANPGAVEVLRNEHATHYRNADGTFSAVISPGINYVDVDSQIRPTAPEVWQTDAGFRQIGTPSPVRIITTSPNQDTIEIWNGTRVASVTTSKLTKTGDFTWTFPWSQITWALEVLPGGWQVTSQPIAAARGVRNYQMPLASTGLNLVPDADGNLVDGTFTITRAVMMRADGVETPCSAWTATAKAAGFTCDDSAFPPAAFPYIIDPTGTYNLGGGSDDGRATWMYHSQSPTGDCTAYWPPDTQVDILTTNTSILAASQSQQNPGPSYECRAQEMLIRFNTTTLPANAGITSATLNLWVHQNTTAADNSYIVYAEYYPGSNWPININMFTAWPAWPASTNAFSAVIKTQPTLQYVAYTLSNVSVAGNIVKGGWTGFRMWQPKATTSGGPAPGVLNRFDINAFELGNAAYLTVTYTTISQKLIVVTNQ